jgi:Fe-S-cluster containining protein
MSSPCFYASGLKFSCKRCSACCRYEPGFVYLSENDLEKLTIELKMDRNGFIKTYCRWVDSHGSPEYPKVLSLKEKSDKDCIFWDGGCTIYNARPFQCVSFPFWESILFSEKAWEIAATGCPGMNSGTLHSKDAIEGYLKTYALRPIISRQGENK